MNRYSTVMIIDDSEMDNFLNKMILETIHYSDRILTYTSPTNALDFFKERSGRADLQSELPQVVFLDINMPMMTGFQFLDEFIKLPKELTSGIQFYMISSSEDPEDVDKTKNYSNVVKYLSKPLDKNQIL